MKFFQIYKPSNLFLNRNFGLDLVRSVAILLVLISHLGISETDTAGLRIGGLGVEMFFVLSGFLIGQIIIRNFNGKVSYKAVKDFWIRRWFRTLPLYYAVILLKYVFIDHSLGLKIIVYFLFLQNNFVGIDFMPITWSLVVEEWFYLILPVLLLLVFRNRQYKPKELTIFIIAFIFCISLFRTLFVLYLNRGYEAINGNFPFRLDSLMCGVMLANIKLNYTNLYKKLATLKLFGVCALLYALLLYAFSTTNMVEGKIDDVIWIRTAWFILNSLIIAGLIPYLEDKITMGSKWMVGLISSISIFSYCAYLIHMEIFRVFLVSELYSGLWLFQSLTCFFITFFVSALVYGIYEKPMTDLRDRFK